MSQDRSTPSFSPSRKWAIGFQVGLVVFLVFAVLVMVNYLSRDLFLRFHLSERTRVQLAPRTLNFLKSFTNQVKVTVYYDKDDPLYTTVISLLKEYTLANSRISVQTIDYLRNPGAAQKVKADYSLDSANDKNLIIFDCAGRKLPKIIPGNALAQYTLEQVPDKKEREFVRKPVAFIGEMVFTGALLDLSNPRPLTAYFLRGHREHPIDSGDEVEGYLKFASSLQQLYIRVESLSLAGTNPIPSDCSLLIIAGPRTAIPENELDKIDQYLSQGGRLLALFNFGSAGRETGLGRVLAKWGIGVGHNVVVDREHSQSGQDVIVSAFSKHPVVNALLGTGLYLLQPRTISRLNIRNQPADAPRVEVIAMSGPNSYLEGSPDFRQEFPLMVAVEKGAIKGVTTERGTTRMVVVGDSLFLGNNQLDLLGNRDFAGYAVNWLLDRSQLLEGLGPRPIHEYRLVMTKQQLQSAQWLLLGGLPGSVLLLGGLVWLRRRS